MNKKIHILFLLLLCLGYNVVVSQTSTSSPYSRFGLGVLSGVTSSEQAAMGGSSVSYINQNSINSYNPATYSSLKPKSLLLSTSMITQTSEFSTSELSQINSNTQFGHIALSMPFNKSFFISTGVLPFSDIGYVIENTQSHVDIGDVDYRYSGEGGISKYYLGASIKLRQSLSLGVNASYLFGGLSNNRDVDFNDPSIFNTNVTDRTNVSGLSLKTGLIYKTSLSDNQELVVGVTYQDNSNVTSRRNLLGTTYEISNSTIFIKDTFVSSIDTGSLVLPSSFSAGLSYYDDKWMFMANYSTQDWENFQIQYGDEIQSDSLNNSVLLSAGFQYTPDRESLTNYWKRIDYRLGARYNKSYINVSENPFQERSVTLGLGFPVRKSNTYYNLSLEIGDRGVSGNDMYFLSTNPNYELIKERFFRCMVGVTFKGVWFVKRQYD